MASDNLELALRVKAAVSGLDSIRALLGEVEELGGESAQAGEQAKALARRIDELTNQARLVEQFRQTKAATADTAQAFAAAQDKASALGRELAQTANPTKKLQRAFEAARAESKRLEQADQDQRLALQRLRGELSGAGVDSRQLARAQRDTKQAIGEAEREVEQLNRELSAQADQLRGNTTQTRSWIDAIRGATRRLRGQQQQIEATDRSAEGLRGTIRNLAAGFVAFIGIQQGLELVRRGLTSILQVGGKFELLDAQLTQLEGSAAAAGQTLDAIRQLARETPFQVEGLTQAYIRLKNFGLDPLTDGSLQALLDQTAALGGGMERLEGISTALGQAFAKQRLQTEEILQLVERGVPAYELLAKVTGKTGQALQKLIESGQLGRETIRALIEEIGRSAQGAAAEQVDNLAGLISNLKDRYEEFLNLIAESGTLEFFKGKIQELLDITRELAESGQLKQYAKRISDAIVTASKAVAGFARQVIENADTIAGGFRVIIAGASLLKNSLEVGFKAIATASSGMVSAVATGAAGVLKVLNKLPGTALLVSESMIQTVEAFAAKSRLATKVLAQSTAESATDTRQALAEVAQAYANLGAATEAGSQQAAAAVADLKTKVAREFAELAEIAQLEGQNFARAFANAVYSAETEAALEELRGALILARDEGHITFAEFDGSLELIEFRLGNIATAAEESLGAVADEADKAEAAVASAFETLGVKSQEELQKAADAARAALDTIRNSADATQQEVAAAFEVYAKRAIAANNGVVPAAIAVQQEMLGIGAAAAAAASQTEGSSARIVAALQSQREELEQIEQNTRNVEQVRAEAVGAAGALKSVVIGARNAFRQYGETAVATFDAINRQIATTGATIGSYLRKLASFTQRLKYDADQQLAFADALTAAAQQGKLSYEALEAAAGLANKTVTNGVARATAAQRVYAGLGSEVRFLGIAASRLGTQFDLLGDKQLQPLRSAINAALADFRELADTIDARTDGLRDELDRLQGDFAAIERRRFENQQADLQALLTKARAGGGPQLAAEAREALRLSEQIHAERLRDIKEEAALRQRRDTETRDNVVPLRREQPSERIELSIRGPSGQPVELTAPSRSAAEQLIEELQAAGLTAQ